ncbi:MAG: dTMP kinase, partial [Pseudomonadota bacterium]
DGSGKTTVSNLVVERLRARGLTVKHLRAEGKFVSSVSEAIRSLARDSKNLELDPRAEFLLYVARDVQLIEEALRQALATHDVVLADRFLYTAEVLARYGRGLPSEYTKPILEAAAGGLAPELVVLIDVDPVLARARRKSFKLVAKDSRPPSRKGLSGVGLQHRLRRGYLELAASAPERWYVTSNEQVLEDTVMRVTELVSHAVEQGPAAALAEQRELALRREAGVAVSARVRTVEDALGALQLWLQQRAEREPHVAAYVLAGLHGAPLDELRQKLAERVPAVVLAGLEGLTDDVSWQLRDGLCHDQPIAVARSLDSVTQQDPRAFALRQRLETLAPAELLRSLARSDDDASWAVRERLYEAHPEAAVSSLAGLPGERAGALRERWFSANKALLADSYELSKVAARSVHGVDDELAWEIREAARHAAPIASLLSVSELSCERSWDLRERSLQRATKVVMETLRRLREPRAWEMRWQVAGQTKEAIDSIADLDDEQAWAMRDAFADVWPSTVVKTLGVLATSERGRALVQRQLAAHPNNVSLLKHAAAIAMAARRGEGSIAGPAATVLPPLGAKSA